MKKKYTRKVPYENFNQGGQTAKQFSKEERIWLKNNPNITLLYYLKEDHYIGITTAKQFFIRLHQHKKAGNWVQDVEIIFKYKDRIKAHLHETLLHYVGYNGFRNLIRS